MAPFPQSTLAVIEVPLEALGKGADGNFHVKAAALGGGEMVDSDDFLGASELGDWLTVPSTFAEQPFSGMDELTGVTKAGAALQLQKGTTDGKLILYYPMNQMGAEGSDTQSQIIDPQNLKSASARN